MKTAIIWLLLVQGTGPSSSAVNTVHKYADETSCKADGEKIKKKFWAEYLCLAVDPTNN